MGHLVGHYKALTSTSKGEKLNADPGFLIQNVNT